MSHGDRRGKPGLLHFAYTPTEDLRDKLEEEVSELGSKLTQRTRDYLSAPRSLLSFISTLEAHGNRGHASTLASFCARMSEADGHRLVAKVYDEEAVSNRTD